MLNIKFIHYFHIQNMKFKTWNFCQEKNHNRMYLNHKELSIHSDMNLEIHEIKCMMNIVLFGLNASNWLSLKLHPINLNNNDKKKARFCWMHSDSLNAVRKL